MNWTSEEIKSFRLLLNLSQTDFGKLLGVSRIHVSYLESGTRVASQTLKNLLNCLEREHKKEDK